MKLFNAFSLLGDFGMAFRVAYLPTLVAVWTTPSLLLHPSRLSRLLFSYVWKVFGDGTDANARPIKIKILPKAYGIVLDIGAGYGHTVHYLVREKVSLLVALEPNLAMHPQLRANANAAGYSEDDGSLKVLSCGAEDMHTIVSAVGAENIIDTVVCVLTLCSVPQPERTIRDLINIGLKPDGQLLMHEHVLNERRADIAWWQWFWTPLWGSLFDGCKLNRPIESWVKQAGPWAEENVYVKEDAPAETLFPHFSGRFVKGSQSTISTIEVVPA